MSPTSKGIALAISFLLLIPAIAMVAAPRAPNISAPSISPTSPGANDQVTVTVTVTAGAVGVHNVTVVYSTDAWKASNKTVIASYNSTSQKATANIPPLYNTGKVEYYIVAYDNSSVRAINDNNGNYWSYTITTSGATSSTSMWITIAIVIAAVGAAVSVGIYALRPRRSTNRTTD